jgi:tetratricopeptide (TPR) repeat protein
MIKHAIHWDAENTTYWLECGNTYMMLGDYKQSWSKFDQARKLLEPRVNASPNLNHVSLLAHALNGGAYARALGGSELKQARKDVDQALKSFPTSAAMIDTRGYICYLSGDYEQALIDTNTAVEISTATYELDKRDKQRKMLKSIRRRVLAKELQMLEETLVELHEHRGLVYQKLGKEDAAQRDLTVAEMYKSRIVAER